MTKPKTVQTFVGGYSSAGIKSENQDAFAALLPSAAEATAKGITLAVADGLSSATKGAEAAQLAVTQFINDYYATSETWSTNKSAAKVLKGLNQWLYSQGYSKNHSNSQWLTTFSALILKSNTGYIFHVGDTRVTKFSNNRCIAITRDHNRRELNQNTVLTRALGADNRLKVDVHQVELSRGDIYLLTCDGVHDFVNDQDLSSFLTSIDENCTSKQLEDISKKITQHAINNGSKDNVTCLIAYIKETPHHSLLEIERGLTHKVFPPPLKAGMKIDEYEVKRVVHQSTRSHLYIVEDKNDLNKIKILKAPSVNFSEDVIYIQGFIREGWIGQRVSHANIMAIEPEKSPSKFLYHICEYIEGQTLTEWMHDNPNPTIAQVRDIINQIITALRVFQRAELVHRDLKPDNIMINQYNQIKLIDYGTVFVASLDENQHTIKEPVPQGSLNYIAPETLLHLTSDYKSDLFSLGVICYEMLTGELPFKPMKRAEVTFDHYSQWQYRSLSQHKNTYPVWLDLALQKATEADPSKRFQAFSEFQAELAKPNLNAIIEYKKLPLIKRNPVAFWQGLSGLLFICLVFALIK